MGRPQAGMRGGRGGTPPQVKCPEEEGWGDGDGAFNVHSQQTEFKVLSEKTQRSGRAGRLEALPSWRVHTDRYRYLYIELLS